jgi:hypothetical protein
MMLALYDLYYLMMRAAAQGVRKHCLRILQGLAVEDFVAQLCTYLSACTSKKSRPVSCSCTKFHESCTGISSECYLCARVFCSFLGFPQLSAQSAACSFSGYVSTLEWEWDAYIILSDIERWMISICIVEFSAWQHDRHHPCSGAHSVGCLQCYSLHREAD